MNSVQLGSDYEQLVGRSVTARQIWSNHSHTIQTRFICHLYCCFFAASLVKYADFHPRRTWLKPPQCKLAVMDWWHRMCFSVTSLDIISQSCPAQEKTYASCFDMKLRPQISTRMIHWNIENNTRNMDSLPPPFLHKHTLSLIHKHFLSSAVCHELQTAFYLKLSQLFPEHDSLSCLPFWIS